jgi:3-methyl-2-oxobutanoate hydroxymethyltransferase
MSERKKVTLRTLFQKIDDGVPITFLTCYDYPTAFFQEQAGVDMILVGDSLGMTMLGYDSTLPVTMEDMIRHSQAVRRGSPNAWLIGDMKLEGGVEMADRMAGITAAGIPAMGHLGLTPQSVSALGGFRVQGKGALQAKKIIDDAKALEDAGAFAILLELVPDRLCKLITERVENCFIIGLGSGLDAHGQLLIYHDMFGLYPKFKPRMAKVFGNAGETILEGIKQYIQEVTDRTFPQPENWFGMSDEEYDELLQMLD